MVEDCVIIGGGVAGLSAANQMVDKGLSSLIIDGGTFPSHKICGEFFSHECLSILNGWKIPLSGEISTARFICAENKTEFRLPRASGSCSRYTFDSMLLDRATKKGARAMTEISVKSLVKSSDIYEVVLSDGQTIKARNLMIGTGRIPKLAQNQKSPEMVYFGFKAHFENIDIGNCVEMHLFPGGYVGISNVDGRTTNIACLVKKEYILKFGEPEDFISRLQEDPSMELFKQRMSKARMVYPKWLMGPLPEFGIRSNPHLDNVYWIGDAAGSIPPICGDGLAIAITSGCMAADSFMHSNADQFRKEWQKRYHRRFMLAKYIHKIMTTRWVKKVAVEACNSFPKLPLYMWSQTREV